MKKKQRNQNRRDRRAALNRLRDHWRDVALKIALIDTDLYRALGTWNISYQRSHVYAALTQLGEGANERNHQLLFDAVIRIRRTAEEGKLSDTIG